MDKGVPMSQQESSSPSQASRSITAERRRATAEERARMLGLRRPSPSAIEAAGAQWQREQEARKRAEQERLIASRQAEMSPFSFQRLALRADDLPPADEALWKVYVPPQPQPQPQPQPHRARRGRIGGFPVGSFATRLIQRERAGGGGIVMDPRARALEEAAQRWEEQRKASSRRR